MRERLDNAALKVHGAGVFQSSWDTTHERDQSQLFSFSLFFVYFVHFVVHLFLVSLGSFISRFAWLRAVAPLGL